MKNKLCYILIGMLLSFSFVNRVFAATVVSTGIDSKNVANGTEVSIKVNLKSDVAISSCLFMVTTDDTITFSSRNGMNNWNVVDSSGGFLAQIINDSSSDVSGGKNVLELKYKINGDGNITIKTDYCMVFGSEEKIVDVANVTDKFTITDTASDTNLSALSVSGGLLSPSFSSGIYSYTITGLSSPNFGLSVTASNSDYQDDIVVKNNNNVISDISNIVFKDESGQGMMPITVTVNGKTTYSLLIIYEQSELDNTLKSITIDGNDLTLVSGKYDYEYTVDKDTKSFSVGAVLSDSENFKFGSSGNFSGTGSFSISDVAYVIIVVEPKSFELGTSSTTYTIKVVKEGTTVVDKKPTGGNVNKNPGTGDVSMYVMAFILIVSLIGSVLLYKKNLEGYK